MKCLVSKLISNLLYFCLNIFKFPTQRCIVEWPAQPFSYSFSHLGITNNRNLLLLLANCLIDVVLLYFNFLLNYLISQRLRQIFPLGVSVQHVRETTLHFCFNLKCFSLNIFHLLFDNIYPLLQKSRIQLSVPLEHLSSS